MYNLNVSTPFWVEPNGTNNTCNSTAPIEDLPFGWSSNTWGFIAASVSVFMFGSFSLGELKKTGFDPMVMQIYMNVAIGLSSLLVLTYNPFFWSTWGILSGGLWLLTNMMAMVAIQFVGISISQGVWSGTTIIVSFIWGAAIFQEEIGNLALTLVGLGILFLGIAGISISGTNLLAEEKAGYENESLVESSRGESYEIIGDEMNERAKPLTTKQIVVGITTAALLGVYAPIHQVGSQNSVAYIVSFGLGLLIVTPAFAIPYFLAKKEKPDWNLKVLPLRAGIAGIMWNIGNWTSLYALQYLGYTVGFPLTQCALLLGGFWGIVLFKEITGTKRIALFFFSCAVLITGAILLGLYGKKC